MAGAPATTGTPTAPGPSAPPGPTAPAGWAGSTANQINLAARLVAEIGDRAEREARIATAAWRAGYQAGFTAGEDVGHGRAHEEIAEAWHKVAEHVRAYGRPGLYPYHELRRRRYQPGGEAYLAALARRGGREYTGGPVQWDVPVGGAA